MSESITKHIELDDWELWRLLASIGYDLEAIHAESIKLDISIEYDGALLRHTGRGHVTITGHLKPLVEIDDD